ncbi:hypothetical protein FRC06_004078 [Ceratobasidium sp. 370]|nr:hypothetical protein FRC06_004078 [Ceratobasidium sp. 370]
MSDAKLKDITRESWAEKLYLKNPRTVEPGLLRTVLLVFHSVSKEVEIKFDLHEHATLQELIYRLNKGIKGTRVTLSQNPYVYDGFVPPYNGAESFCVAENDGSGSISQKRPENDLEAFRDNDKPIHIYFDRGPLISLEDPAAKWSFSWAKWYGGNFPNGMLRGRNGILYDGKHLMRLISYHDLAEPERIKRMNAWRVSASATSPPSDSYRHNAAVYWGQEPSSARRLPIMIDKLRDQSSAKKGSKVYGIMVSSAADSHPSTLTPGSTDISGSTESSTEPVDRAEVAIGLEQQCRSKDTAAHPQGGHDDADDDEWYDCRSDLSGSREAEGSPVEPSVGAPKPLNGSNLDTAPIESTENDRDNPPEPLSTPATGEPDTPAQPVATAGSNELPATIKSIQSGWQKTFQSSSVISAALAVIESILFILFSDLDSENFNLNSPSRNALHMMNYLAFFSAIGATSCSLFLTHEFGELHFRAAKRALELEPPIGMVAPEDMGKLLRHYGVYLSKAPSSPVVAMSVGLPEIGVAYELPATIKSIQQGWLVTFQNASNMSTLFTVVDIVLLVFFNNLSSGKSGPESSGRRALRILNYLALLSSISATLYSLFLTKEFGELPARAARREPELDPVVNVVVQEDAGELLRRYGARRIVKHMTLYWILMIHIGFLSLVAQLLVYVWIVEARPVAIAVSCVTGFALLPLLSIFPSS